MCLGESHVGLVGSRTFAGRQNVLWRWFYRRLDEMVSLKSRGLRPALSYFFPLTHVLPAVHTWAPSVRASSSFTISMELYLTVPAKILSPSSVWVYTACQCDQNPCAFYGVLSKRFQFFKGKEHTICFIPIITLFLNLPIDTPNA